MRQDNVPPTNALDWNPEPYSAMYEVPSNGSPIIAFKATENRLAAKTEDGRWHIIPLDLNPRQRRT